MKFNDLQSAADSRMRRVVPACQLRLCLRLWSAAGPLHHRRARFAPLQPGGFEAAAGTDLKTVATCPLVISCACAKGWQRSLAASRLLRKHTVVAPSNRNGICTLRSQSLLRLAKEELGIDAALGGGP